jgi:hypothetical protein
MGKAARQAWPTHHALCTLGPLEPTGVLGRRVQRQLLHEPSGLHRGDSGIPRRGAMGERVSQTTRLICASGEGASTHHRLWCVTAGSVRGLVPSLGCQPACGAHTSHS